ncbi:hypothetical protein R6Q59_032559 [Mikania micrantha]
MDSIASPTISDQQHAVMYMTDTPADVVRRWYEDSELQDQMMEKKENIFYVLIYQILLEVVMDANYLNIIELLDLICEKVVYLIKGKTP